MTPSDWTLIRTALRRGLRKRCPHCGEGRLYSGWSQLERCSSCGLVYSRNPGDVWAFIIFGDRLPIAAIIAVIYFGVLRFHRVLGLAMLAVVAGVGIWTTQNRWGAGIALHYLSRIFWPDPRTRFLHLLRPAPAGTPTAEAAVSILVVVTKQRQVDGIGHGPVAGVGCG